MKSADNGNPPPVATEGLDRLTTHALFQAIFRDAAMPIGVTDLQGRFMVANKAFCEMLGYSMEELLQLDFLTITHPEDRTRQVELRQRITDGVESRFVYEKRYLRKDGQFAWCRLSASPLKDDQGTITHLIGIAEDISERKKLEQEVADSEQLLKYVAQAMLDVAWDWNIERDTLWWSKGLKKVFGYEAAEISNSKEWLALVHPEDRQEAWDKVCRALAGPEDSIQMRYRFKRKDAGYAHLEVRCFLIRNEQGRVLRVVGGLFDITQHVELEEQLLQSQRLRSLGQLTGGVAHDFNNLLTVILGNAELLAEELDSGSNLRELTGMISQAAQKGAELTRHLLAFARRQALEPKVVDINQLLDAMEPMLRRTLGEHIRIKVSKGRALSNAMVDPNQLESALLNLCINSRDAMEKGGVLTLETRNVWLDADYSMHHAEVKPGPYVEIVVSDTGTGIPPSLMERVFEPFFTTKEKGKGTGLGLSTVFGFIKQSNGHVNLYSEPGQGTSVKMYLPQAGGQAGMLSLEMPGLGLNGGSETVLLVEDDELVRKFAHGQLLSMGYRVLFADNGERALDILRGAEEIDLLFTDVIMKGMGGPELVEKALLLRPRLKVLYTSGYTENSIVHDGRLDEGVHLLSKPYQRTDLATKLREVLDEAGEGADA